MEFTIFSRTITITVMDNLQRQVSHIVRTRYKGPHPKIHRIKAYREIKGCRLMEAKEAIEEMYESSGQGDPR